MDGVAIGRWLGNKKKKKKKKKERTKEGKKERKKERKNGFVSLSTVCSARSPRSNERSVNSLSLRHIQKLKQKRLDV